MTTMSSERAEEPTTPDNQPGSPGRVLASQREAMGWTVEQVADQLKLAVRQVVALEAGDYASLPSPAVTRGFVRAYAKLVRVDPAPLVAQIAIDMPPEAGMNTSAVRRPTPASFSQAKFPSHSKRSLPLGWIAAAVVLAAAAGAAWHFGLIPTGHHGDAAVATPATSAASHGASTEAVNGSSTETLQNPSVPLISVPGPASASADASGAATAPAAAPGPVVNMPATTATGAPPTTIPAAPANPVTAAAPAAAPAAAGAGTLVLTVREDAWIEVRPAKGGAPMIKRLVKAGSTETVNVDQPLRVIVGNPGSVSASLRGAPVALPAVPGKTYSLVNLQ
jgi:cytoskeleton protein RodZ